MTVITAKVQVSWRDSSPIGTQRGLDGSRSWGCQGESMQEKIQADGWSCH